MNELQRFTSELTITDGREKNLYKMQMIMSPQLYRNFTPNEAQKEMQKSALLFSTTTDDDFIRLLKLASSVYVQELKMGVKALFTSDYILSCTRLMKYLKHYNLATLEELASFIQLTIKQKKAENQNFIFNDWRTYYENVFYHYYLEKQEYINKNGTRKHLLNDDVYCDDYCDYLGDLLKPIDVSKIEI